MKIAFLHFRSPDVRRAYLSALWDKLYAAGYPTRKIDEVIDPMLKSLSAQVVGTSDAERAHAVAQEMRSQGVRGIMSKLVDG